MVFLEIILAGISVHVHFCSFFAIFSLWNNYTSILFLLKNIHVPFSISTAFNPLFAPQLSQFLVFCFFLLVVVAVREKGCGLFFCFCCTLLKTD